MMTMNSNYPAVLFDILSLYLKECTFNLGNGSHDDGRIASIEHEKDVINKIRQNFECQIPPPRHWYDIAIMSNDIPIYCNIKISTGKTDNAMQKKGLIHSLTNLNEKYIKGGMSYNTMMKLIEDNLLESRDYEREYYYVYIDKNDGTIIIRSMLDIVYYQSNPCNILQINWNKAKLVIEHNIVDDILENKERIEKIIAKSQKQYFENNFAYYKKYYDTNLQAKDLVES